MLLTEFKFYSDVVSAGSGDRSRSFWNDGTYKRWFLYYVLLSISLAVIFLNFGKPDVAARRQEEVGPAEAGGPHGGLRQGELDHLPRRREGRSLRAAAGRAARAAGLWP